MFHSDQNTELPHFSSYYMCACKNCHLSCTDSRILAVLIESTQRAPAVSPHVAGPAVSAAELLTGGMRSCKQK